MAFLDGRYATEPCCKFREAFLFGLLCKSLVHVGPFVVLTVGCGREVLRRVSYAVKFLEPELCVLLLVLRRLKEQGGYLLKPFLFAFEAKKVYLLRACDSPAKAASRFFSVCVPEYFVAIIIRC